MAKRQIEEKNGKTSLNEHGRKLLLVDEDTNDLDYYSEVLRYLGYEVQAVDSYTTAAGMLGRERFDLIIVDQGSSNFEGRAVLSRVVELDHHVPVLVLTRTVDADCCLEALDTGAYEYVQKPLTTAEIRELVSDYVKPPQEEIPSGRPYTFAGEVAAASNPAGESDSWRRAS